MMKGQARRSGLVMGFDTHMIAGAVPALRPARPTQPNITNRSNPHYDETLTFTVGLGRRSMSYSHDLGPVRCNAYGMRPRCFGSPLVGLPAEDGRRRRPPAGPALKW